jgi:hypothetical protein
MDNADLRNMLERAIISFRRGQVAAATLASNAYQSKCGLIPVVQDMICAGNFLGAADVLEQGFLPRHK